MKLVPKVKPVKIRIKLGEVECSSLQEVKDHLSSDNLEKLVELYRDGRFERWLRQNGENAKADKLKQLNSGKDKKLQLLGIVDDELAKVLDKYNGDWNTILLKATPDEFRSVYSSTKDLEWPSKIMDLKDLPRIKILWGYDDFRQILNADDWALLYGTLAKDVKTYQDIFYHLFLYAKHHPEECEDIFCEFYKSAPDYSLDKTVVDKKTTVEKLQEYYCILNKPDIHIDWGSLFAEKLSGWNDRGQVEAILKSQPEQLKSFYEYFAEKRGVAEARYRLDPWYEFKADKQAKEVAVKAIENFVHKPHNFSKSEYSSSDNSCLKEVLDFLQFAQEMLNKSENGYKRKDWDNIVDKYLHNPSVLSEQRIIVYAVNYRYTDKYWQLSFRPEHKEILYHLSDDSKPIIKFVEDGHNYTREFILKYIARKYLVSKIYSYITQPSAETKPPVPPIVNKPVGGSSSTTIKVSDGKVLIMRTGKDNS